MNSKIEDSRSKDIKRNRAKTKKPLIKRYIYSFFLKREVLELRQLPRRTHSLTNDNNDNKSQYVCRESIPSRTISNERP